ncbi:hypothetical protein F5B20DRAFT_548664 [Whalleya microplaca]|nr:hypothetical protein F5B20DRAFT_548664 [Whalleya microplaca]
MQSIGLCLLELLAQSKLPTGPVYLDVDELDKGCHAHLMIMHDSSSWLHSGLSLIKRIFKADGA